MPTIKKNLPSKPDGYTLVIRDNRIVQGRSNLTPTQDKLLDYHVACIRKDPGRERCQFIRYEDFASLLPGKAGTGLKKSSYLASRLKPFLKDCLSKVIALRNEDEKSTTYLQWWSLAKTNEDDNEGFYLELHEKIAPYLIENLNEYTPYHLKIIFSFQSNHSQTLYRLLKQYHNTETKKREFDLNDFRFHMDVIDKYSQFGMLLKRVIEPSVKEINELSDIIVEYDFKKRGKKYTGLTFYIAENAKYKSRAVKGKDLYKAGVIDVAPTTAADVLKAAGVHELDAKTFGLALEADKLDAAAFVTKVRKSYEKSTQAKPFGSYLFGALKKHFGKKE